MSARPLNLLLIETDQHARFVAGCYGHREVRTPSIDALASRGTVFDAAYCASPICVPSRAAMATGRHLHETGYWDTNKPYDGRVRSWMHELRQAGVPVVSVGKLHYRSTEDDVGFEQINPMHAYRKTSNPYYLVREPGVTARDRRKNIIHAGPGKSDYVEFDRVTTRAACEWIAARAEGSAPWVLQVGFVSPHPPLRPPAEYFDRYVDAKLPPPLLSRFGERPDHPVLIRLRTYFGLEDLDDPEVIRRATAAYLALTTFVDDCVGAVLQALTRGGSAGRTLVIYTSDHGDYVGRRGMWGKYGLHDESVGVPLVMSGPGVPDGVRITDPVSQVDLYPTILAAMQVNVSEAPVGTRSLFDIIGGRSLARPILAQYHDAGSLSASFMLRRGRYKLLYHVAAPAELYDLDSDPDETRDLTTDDGHVETHAALEVELRRLLDPEAVDQAAKADQQRRLAAHGGREAVLADGLYAYTPVPGRQPEFLTCNSVAASSAGRRP